MTYDDGSGVGDRAWWPSVESSTGAGALEACWFLRGFLAVRPLARAVGADEETPVRLSKFALRVFDRVKGPSTLRSVLEELLRERRSLRLPEFSWFGVALVAEEEHPAEGLARESFRTLDSLTDESFEAAEKSLCRELCTHLSHAQNFVFETRVRPKMLVSNSLDHQFHQCFCLTYVLNGSLVKNLSFKPLR